MPWHHERCRNGGMVYAIDSKSVAERLEGSSPSSGTQVEAKKPKIIVVLGPTSSGKTALSVELAKKHNGEIVSADSRQVYRGMNLGTGKVAKKEMCGIPHHLLDVVSPKKVFTVSEYAELAKKAINDIVSRGKVPIVCGGTGFYIDTLTRGTVLPEVPPNLTLRKKLEKKSLDEILRGNLPLNYFINRSLQNVIYDFYENKRNHSIEIVKYYIDNFSSDFITSS